MPRNRREDSTIQDPSSESELRGIAGVPFYFNPDIMRFVVGPVDQARIIAPEELDSVFDIVRKTHDLDGKIDPKSEELLYLVPIATPLQLESFRRRLSSLSQNPQESWEVVLKVEKTMESVYKAVDPTAEIPRRKSKPGKRDWMQFAAGFDQSGEFRVQTFGNCACMGFESVVHTTLASYEHDRKTDLSLPLRYWVHNVDRKAEMISLYAGAGALAYLVKNRPQPSSVAAS